MSKTLYTYKCPDCKKVFRTDNPEEKVCPTCQKYRQPNHTYHKKIKKKKILTLAEIMHIAEVYAKVRGKYLHYGDIVNLVESNAEHCVCCGATIPEGRQVCSKCESKCGGKR